MQCNAQSLLLNNYRHQNWNSTWGMSSVRAHQNWDANLGICTLQRGSIRGKCSYYTYLATPTLHLTQLGTHQVDNLGME